MRKKMLLSLFLMTTIGSTSVLATANIAQANTNQSVKMIQDIESNKINDSIKSADDFMNTNLAKEYNAEIVDKAPRNAEVIKFNTWEEAYDYLETIEVESEKVEKESKEYLEKAGKAIPSGVDRYIVKPIPLKDIPSGKATRTYKVSLDVPGFSAQNVISEHTIAFNNKKVTSANRGSYISGLGLANWSTYYSGLDDYPTTKDSVIKGKCGYYLSVGGVQVGVSKKWGLVVSVNK